jgi:predicted AlkP superfamily pyrophosphatase or phosphodiesterase
MSVFCLATIIMGMKADAVETKIPVQPPKTEAISEHVILFVLEGVGQEAIKTGPMPVLGRFVKEGAVTWSAAGVSPTLRLPSMASLVTGLPVEKHGVTWDSFDFARGYPRPPTVFDYLDLSGGKDSAIFYMDESLYQLAKPEPYTDYQICGALRPECNTATMLTYIRDYFRKATSGHGYGHAILSLPHFLVFHLPQPGRAAQSSGLSSREYKDSLRDVDKAMGAVLDIYKQLGLLNKTTVIVTGLTGVPRDESAKHEANGSSGSRLPWIAWGAGIRAGYTIKQPVSIIDTGATVLRTMNLETYTEWDSRPVEEIFTTPRTAAAETGNHVH